MMNTLIITGCIISTVLILYFQSVRIFKKFFVFYNYKRIMGMFSFFLERSYELSYENSIVTWIANGIQNIPDSEKETIERDFVKQSFMIIGESNIKILTDFFGDEKQIINYMILFIRKKIANDGIAAALKDVTSESELK